MIGKIISHYKILEKLGEGGMGVVYKAEDTKLKREVAIKFLPHYISSNEEEQKRFEIEAQAAASLNHPNITTIHSIEEADGQVFIVMEYIDGKELKDIVGAYRDMPLSINDVLNYAIQIAAGLEAAHKKGIVHRDIKSGNIMITQDGNVKIMDFGLAKIGKGSQVTKIGSTVGTIAYMSPEQARGEELDHRTDIWSFGVVLYEMLTGKQPFKGDYDQAVIYSILNTEPELASKLNLVDVHLKTIINKALQKEPDKRYQTANELLNDLAAVRSGHSLNFKEKNGLPKKVWITGAILLTLIVTALLLKNFLPVFQTQNVTIAVLPFSDLSPAKDQAYLGDGLAEQLLNNLANIGNLKVIAKTSSFALRDKNLTIQDLAGKLNVSNILEGSVQKIGNRVRITAQLIDASNGYGLWSETYDRDLNDIFEIQDDICGSVIKELKVKLLGIYTLSSGKKKEDPQAYNACLQGSYFHNLRGKEYLEKAVYYFEQALKIDSNYARAWAGLALVHSSQADFGYMPAESNNKKALLESEKALELDPTMAEAYSTIGWIKRIYYWDWTGADKAYQRALELARGNSGILIGTGALASTLGRFDEAIRLNQQDIELNPLSVIAYINLGLRTYYVGQLDKAEKMIRKALEMNPQFPGAYALLGKIFITKLNHQKALSEMQKEQDPLWSLYGLALAYYAVGKKEEADSSLDEFIEKYQGDAAFQVAEIFAFRRDIDNAFKWLELAYRQRDSGLATIIGDPLLMNIKKDPRYSVFLKKMKLPL